MLLMAHRRLVNDDPLGFAISDRNSWLSFGLIDVIIVLAI
jgi:hypothetical protein